MQVLTQAHSILVRCSCSASLSTSGSDGKWAASARLKDESDT